MEIALIILTIISITLAFYCVLLRKNVAEADQARLNAHDQALEAQRLWTLDNATFQRLIEAMSEQTLRGYCEEALRNYNNGNCDFTESRKLLSERLKSALEQRVRENE